MLVRLLCTRTEEYMFNTDRDPGWTAALAAFSDRHPAKPPSFTDTISLDTLAQALQLWHETRYGRRKPGEDCPHGVTLSATLIKFEEEVQEFRKAFADRKPEDVAEEAADVIFVLFHLVRGVGAGLPGAMASKLNVIFRRLQDDAAGRKDKAAKFPDQYVLDGSHV